MSDARDMSGVWYGDYRSGDAQVESNGFIARFEEEGGRFGGIITERDIWRGTGIVRALAAGIRSDGDVSFTKTYDGSGDLAHSVEYRGTVNEDGTEIRGAWMMPGHHGSFTMSREKFAGLDAEIEEAAAV